MCDNLDKLGDIVSDWHTFFFLFPESTLHLVLRLRGGDDSMAVIIKAGKRLDSRIYPIERGDTVARLKQVIAEDFMFCLAIFYSFDDPLADIVKSFELYSPNGRRLKNDDILSQSGVFHYCTIRMINLGNLFGAVAAA